MQQTPKLCPLNNFSPCKPECAFYSTQEYTSTFGHNKKDSGCYYWHMPRVELKGK